MAIGTATAIGIAGAAATTVGVIGGAVAAGDEAEARASSQNQLRRQLLKTAQPTAQELSAIRSETEIADRQIKRQERLLESVDPALKEAGQQALALLQGKEAAALAPLRRRRREQRTRLENQLRQQLGAGFETSSVAQEALTRFDVESQETEQAAQTETAAKLLGIQQQGLAARQGAEATISGARGVAAERQGILAQRRVSAVTAAGRRISGEEAGAQGRAATFGAVQGVGQAVGSVGGLLAGQQAATEQADAIRSIGRRETVPTFRTQVGAPIQTQGTFDFGAVA